jgi:hypothetical protein
VITIISGLEGTKRWYDNDATVSLAVSILRNSDSEKQKIVSQKILEITELNNIKPKDVSFYIKTFNRRWYDYDETVSTAMESFKIASLELQKEIAVQIINALCEME